jgi:hypothetical protein
MSLTERQMSLLYDAADGDPEWLLPSQSDKESTISSLEGRGLIERDGYAFRITAEGRRVCGIQ